MNKLFLILFIFSCISTLLVDRKELKEANKLARGLYFALFGAVLLLTGLRVADVEVPLPTKLVVHTFVPWAKDLIESYQ
jgi:hypothetical protein